MNRKKLQVTLSKEQARDFANAVFSDIADYVESHREEFKQFLKEEYNIDDTEVINKSA